MVEATVKCQICGKNCTGETALTHKNETGHNKWELILPDVVDSYEMPNL